MTSFLCTLGFHSGNWRWTGNGNDCKQVKHCQRYPCDFTDERMRHDHQLPPDGRLMYRDDDDDCVVYGVCTRCHNIGGRLGPVHRWGDNQYRYDEDEGQMYAWQGCRHCPAIRERATVPIEFIN